MWRIFYPLRYFRLSNKEKSKFDAVPSAIFAVLLSTIFILVPAANFFQVNGFLDKLIGLSGALTGFYVAALVAAATFQHPELDKVISAGPIALVSKQADGTKISEALTRREFTCMIFGYLSFSTLFFSIAASLAVSLSATDYSFLPYVTYLKFIMIFAFSIWIGHIATVSSLGIYYLMDRLYRKDRQVTTRKPRSDVA